MKKIGFFYSIFCCDDISKSMRYLVPFLKNVKLHGECMHEFSDIVLHTDSFTLGVLERMAVQEGMTLSGIVVRVHPRNLYLRGMVWRFESFYSVDYEICVNAEGDWDIRKYLKYLSYFEKDTTYAYLLLNARRFAINPNCFAAGCVIVRPLLTDAVGRERLRLCVGLTENIEHVHYGIDEKLFVLYCKLFFTRQRGCIVINDTMKIFQHVENFEDEKRDISKVFGDADIVNIRVIDKFGIDPAYKTREGKLKLQNEFEDCYMLEGRMVPFCGANRSPENPWAETELIKLYETILKEYGKVNN